MPLIILLTGLIGNILISTITGVLASFIVWWLTFKYWIPEIRFASFISKEITNENASGVRYRLKFENSGSRNIIDLEVIVRLRIKVYDNTSQATGR